MEKAKTHELEFISQLNRDGSGVTPIDADYLKAMHENPLMQDFDLSPLSLTEGTYVAFNFNVFIVKKKTKL